MFVGGAGVGFHTMFLLDLSSVFLYVAALCTFVYACAVRPFGALPRILNILVCHTIVSPWFLGLPYSDSLCVFAGGFGLVWVKACAGRPGPWSALAFVPTRLG